MKKNIIIGIIILLSVLVAMTTVAQTKTDSQSKAGKATRIVKIDPAKVERDSLMNLLNQRDSLNASVTRDDLFNMYKVARYDAKNDAISAGKKLFAEVPPNDISQAYIINRLRVAVGRDISAVTSGVIEVAEALKKGLQKHEEEIFKVKAVLVEDETPVVIPSEAKVVRTETRTMDAYKAYMEEFKREVKAKQDAALEKEKMKPFPGRDNNDQ